MAKIFGWALLIGGVLIIVWSLSSSYNIFIGKTPVPALFAPPKAVKTSVAPQDIQGQLGNLLGDQLRGLLPSDAVSKTLNLATWSLLASLLVFGGSQLAGLGIKLVK